MVQIEGSNGRLSIFVQCTQYDLIAVTVLLLQSYTRFLENDQSARNM